MRVRRELLPLMQELSPRIVEHLAALADMLAQAPDEPLAGLGRAQRQAVERARHLGRAQAVLRIKGGDDLTMTFPEPRIVPTKKP